MAGDISVFFFQAEDGIRDHCVTGVQTCALPIFIRGRFHATVAFWDCLQTSSRTIPMAAPAAISHVGLSLVASSTASEPIAVAIASKIGRASCRERVWLEEGAVLWKTET